MYFYIHGPDNDAELRFSIRSVVQNFQGEAKITVIGERPGFYTGHFIDCPSKKRRNERDAFLDTQRKIVVASTHPEIDEEFVWLADDVFFAKPVTIEDLKVVRYDPWWKPRSNKLWHRLITETFKALRENGKQNIQAATHLPHFVNKQKLVEMFVAYRYPERLLLWELLYSNHYVTDAVPYGSTWEGVTYPQFLKRILRRPRSLSQFEVEAGDASVINWQAAVYSQIAKAWLESKFPTKTEFE